MKGINKPAKDERVEREVNKVVADSCFFLLAMAGLMRASDKLADKKLQKAEKSNPGEDM